MIYRAGNGPGAKAFIADGMAVCPRCWRVLCEPVSGHGTVSVWCSRCRELREVQFFVKRTEGTRPESR